MMGLVNFLRLAECYLIIIFICLFNELLNFATAQGGFLSLQCCATSNYTNPKNNITWIPDGDFINHNGKCQNISNIPAVRDDSYRKARIFGTGSGKKWCYSLETIKGRDYLIRATFLHDRSFQDSPITAFFDVSIGTTIVAQVNKSSEKSSEVEAIFTATDNYINFCLVGRNGNPYLSKLELRPLKESLYFKNDSSTVLKLLSRINVGNTKEIIRFPIDQSDRIWNISEIQDGNANPISNAGIAVHGANSTIPLQVLQTALDDEEQLEFSYNNLDEGYRNYLIRLYFLELDGSVKSGQRVFDVFVNGVKRLDKFDILGDGRSSNYRELVVPVSANGVLNLSLIKAPGVALGPICNAYEILQIHSSAQRTHQADVEKALQLRDELAAKNAENEVLEDWTGDPCLPVPWEGVLCEPISDGSFVIVYLDLSFKDLQGSIPPVVAELTNLKSLNLSFNRFTAAIPSFPVSSKLMSMDVSHNELTGPIPVSLAALPHLTKLYFGCNPHFGNYYLPSSFANRLNLTTDSGICGGQGSTSSHPIFIGTVAGGSLLFTVTIGVLFACFYRRKMLPRRKFKREHPVMNNAIFSLPSMDDLGFKSISTQPFTLECIETATHKYNTLIGEGGFGSVYRGILPDGQEVAVKVRSATSTQGTREFENELNLLSAIQNENLVPLLGYCCENDQQILVYPFMSNGSLQDRLYGEPSKRKALDWPTRLSIALGAARGLFYLHTFAGRGVIHRDVKSSNILLDHSMCAKVADFGFSKYAPQEGDSGASLEVRGTAGYLDPEYYSTQHLSAKSDVFSFGVVLLEIVSGREPLDVCRPRNEWSLVEWAKPFIRESKIEEIVDPNIKGGYHAEAMWRVVEVALACIEPFSTYRPCMDDIVRELEDALIIENNASEYMKSIDSFAGSNRFPSIDQKINQINLPVTPSTAEPSPIISHALSPPQPR